ncbi:hypothetical protein IU510_30220 [Nocardia cyriacigeorgica]|uniref:hypothetical protein n=1 Tax=Nocardia TaxID=1817 RepID=UPI0018945761|nr:MULTISPECIES: hypothetical protein [Nocardia]MBF6102298.1 hypothetical protein [Nocardia cyriacigeorgica]
MTLLLDLGDYSVAQTVIGGIGLRAAELAAALSAHFPVYLYSPATGSDEPVDVGAAELVTDPADWPGLLTDAAAVFFFDMPDLERMKQAATAGALIVSENTVPIEQLDYPRLRHNGVFDTRSYQQLVATYRYQLTHSQLFIARSSIERTTLIGNLAAYGLLSPTDLDRCRRLSHRITTIPLGYSSHAAHAARRALWHRRAEVVWTGGLWPFTDPCAAVRAVAAARADGTALTLRFLHATPHPDTTATLAAVADLAHDLGIADQIVAHTDPIRHDDRDRHLRDATALICLTRPGIENETCVRLRIRDSRLHAVPLIVDPFGATATELAADGLAAIFDPADPAAISAYLADRITGTPEPIPPGQTRWTYEHTITPLVEQLHQHLN